MRKSPANAGLFFINIPADFTLGFIPLIDTNLLFLQITVHQCPPKAI